MLSAFIKLGVLILASMVLHGCASPYKPTIIENGGDRLQAVSWQGWDSAPDGMEVGDAVVYYRLIPGGAWLGPVSSTNREFIIRDPLDGEGRGSAGRGDGMLADGSSRMGAGSGQGAVSSGGGASSVGRGQAGAGGTGYGSEGIGSGIATVGDGDGEVGSGAGAGADGSAHGAEGTGGAFLSQGSDSVRSGVGSGASRAGSGGAVTSGGDVSVVDATMRLDHYFSSPSEPPGASASFLVTVLNPNARTIVDWVYVNRFPSRLVPKDSCDCVADKYDDQSSLVVIHSDKPLPGYGQTGFNIDFMVENQKPEKR